jgi:hypothetical protein
MGAAPETNLKGKTMIRNLKILGLAMAAVLALSAVVASAASAQQGKFTSDGPVTLKGTENAGTTNALTAFGLTIKCPESTYTGHKYNVTPHAFIPNNVTTITITPHYKQTRLDGDANCRVTPGDFPVTIDMEGCDYVVHLGVTTAPPNTYGVTYSIVCPQGPPPSKIKLTVWTTDHEHTTNLPPFCIVEVGQQAGLAGGHVTDTTDGTLDLNGTVEGIALTRKNNTGAADTHTVLCPETTSTTGKFDINATVKGTNEIGGATTIGISE